MSTEAVSGISGFMGSGGFLIIMMIVSSAPKLAPLREKLNWGYVKSKLFKKKQPNAETDIQTEP